jgi:hypothetical protein
MKYSLEQINKKIQQKEKLYREYKREVYIPNIERFPGKNIYYLVRSLILIFEGIVGILSIGFYRHKIINKFHLFISCQKIYRFNLKEARKSLEHLKRTKENKINDLY